MTVVALQCIALQCNAMLLGTHVEILEGIQDSSQHFNYSYQLDAKASANKMIF